MTCASGLAEHHHAELEGKNEWRHKGNFSAYKGIKIISSYTKNG